MPTARQAEGVQDAIKRLRKFIMAQEVIPQQVMQSYANDLKAEIQMQTPYKSGALESSVYVHVNKAGKYRTTLAAGANAFSKGYNYSLVQHERDDFVHPIKGKSHYVEDPFNIVTERIKESLRIGIEGSHG